jgi:hypothetical protein
LSKSCQSCWMFMAAETQLRHASRQLTSDQRKSYRNTTRFSRFSRPTGHECYILRIFCVILLFLLIYIMYIFGSEIKLFHFISTTVNFSFFWDIKYERVLYILLAVGLGRTKIFWKKIQKSQKYTSWHYFL